MKRLDSNTEAFVYHRAADFNGDGSPETDYARLAGDSAFADNASWWNDTAPTATQFTVGSVINVNGAEYAVYLFAHDTDANIECGGYTGTGALNAIGLSWEPQFVLIKRVDASGNWQIWDNQREESSAPARLFPNTNSVEQGLGIFGFTATGFEVSTSVSDVNASGGEYMFVAIGVGAT